MSYHYLFVTDRLSVHLIKAIVLCHAAATGQPHDPKIKNALDRFTADLDPQWKEPMIDDTGIKVVSAATASLVGLCADVRETLLIHPTA